MKRRAITYVGLLLLAGLGLVSCKKSSTSIVDEETQKVNSKNPSIFLTGDFQAVYVEWLGSYKGTEGQNWTDTPTTISGNYTMSAVRSSKGDSLVIVLNGSGKGPTFKNDTIGTFGISADIAAGGISGQVVYTEWTLTDKNIKNRYDHSINVSRSARTNGTLFTFEFNLSKVTNPKAADYGHYICYSADRFSELSGVGHFIFRRLSPGIVTP